MTAKRPAHDLTPPPSWTKLAPAEQQPELVGELGSGIFSLTQLADDLEQSVTEEKGVLQSQALALVAPAPPPALVLHTEPRGRAGKAKRELPAEAKCHVCDADATMHSSASL